MELKIPIDLANHIINYLANRPYQEVFQLIDGIKDAAKPKIEPVKEQNPKEFD